MEKQINKIPLVRFPEFKDGWQNELLGKHIKKTDKKNKEDLNLPVYSINNKEGFLPQSEQFDGVNSKERGFDISIYKIIQPKTFAYNPARINVGSIGYSHDLENILISSLYVCFQTDDKIEDSFLLQFLDTDIFKTSVLRYQEGGVRQYLFFDSISKIPFSIPNLAEQKKIANFFSIVDQKLNQLQEKLNGLEQYKKGMMQRIFSQQLRFKDDNGNDYPEWEVKRLGEVGKALIGLTYSPNDVVVSDGTLVLRSSNVQDKRLAFEDNVYVKGEISEKNFVKENDILVCARNGSRSLIGKSALITKEYENCAFGAFMSIYRSDFNKFFFHVFQTEIFDKQITQHLGATINQITNKSLISFKFPVPCTEEQTKIANFLSKIDDKINTVTEKIEQTKAYKKGLLQKMFCN